MAESDSTTETSPPTPASSPPLPAGKDYHAFICFNSADQEWVDDTIAYLESPEFRFKCVDHRRDFIPGKTVISNIDEFIEKSWKYVLVVTPDFLQSNMCNMEKDIMMKLSADQQEECIIPVLLKPCQVPRALSSLTYIEVGQSDKWKEKLVKALQRKDITNKRKEVNTVSMKQLLKESKSIRGKYQESIDQYKQNKESLEAEKKTLESQVNNAFDICIKNMVDTMNKLRQKKVQDVHFQIDRKIAALVQKIHTAQNIVSYLDSESKKDTTTLKSFTSRLDEYEELERRQRETSHMEFMVSTCFVEKMTQLMSEFDVGYLREMDISQIKSQKGTVNTPKEISLTCASSPQRRSLTQRSLVRRPSFQFDSTTVHANRSILPDGSLYNQRPSQPHLLSDRRLGTYRGAVGTTRFTAGGVYYWVNVVNVDLGVKLEGTELIFEVGLSARGVIDDNIYISSLAETVSLILHRCTEHAADSVCWNVFKNDVESHHRALQPNAPGKWSQLVLGFLLDTVKMRWTVYDVRKKEKITTLKDIGHVQEFTPMFAVCAPSFGRIQLSLVTGTDINISEDMYNLIQKTLELE